MQRVALGFGLSHTRACLEILLLIEAVAEALAGFLHFLLNLVVVLCNLVLNQYIGTITLLRVAVVDEGIVESIHVAAGLPNGGMHEDGRVDAHNVLVEQHHRFPPILLDIVFQLNTVLTVIINGTESVVNFATREDKAIFLAVAHNLLEYIFLCHNFTFKLPFLSLRRGQIVRG